MAQPPQKTRSVTYYEDGPVHFTINNNGTETTRVGRRRTITRPVIRVTDDGFDVVTLPNGKEVILP